MIRDASRQVELLSEIAGGKPLRWIKATKARIAADTEPFVGKEGWLRFMGSDGAEAPETYNIVAALKLPKPGNRVLMSGEWIDGEATTRVSLCEDGLIGRTIAEVAANVEDALPVICRDATHLVRKLPDRPGSTLAVAVYYGFRSAEDFGEGRLACVAERFIGFVDGEQVG